MGFKDLKVWCAAALILAAASSLHTQPRSQCIGICDQPLAVRVYKTAAQSIPNATFTVLNFPAESFDDADFHDNVTNNDRITIPVSGVYIGACFIDWASSSAGQRITRIVLNGASTLFQTNESSNATVTAPEHTGTWMARLNAGDYLTCSGYQNSGAALNAAGVAEYGSTFFWVMRVK